jgi:hypothetical protein
LRKAA